jgi:hypothetical protein
VTIATSVNPREVSGPSAGSGRDDVDQAWRANDDRPNVATVQRTARPIAFGIDRIPDHASAQFDPDHGTNRYASAPYLPIATPPSRRT